MSHLHSHTWTRTETSLGLSTTNVSNLQSNSRTWPVRDNIAVGERFDQLHQLLFGFVGNPLVIGCVLGCSLGSCCTGQWGGCLWLGQCIRTSSSSGRCARGRSLLGIRCGNCLVLAPSSPLSNPWPSLQPWPCSWMLLLPLFPLPHPQQPSWFFFSWAWVPRPQQWLPQP